MDDKQETGICGLPASEGTKTVALQQETKPMGMDPCVHLQLVRLRLLLVGHSLLHRIRLRQLLGQHHLLARPARPVLRLPVGRRRLQTRPQTPGELA